MYCGYRGYLAAPRDLRISAPVAYNYRFGPATCLTPILSQIRNLHRSTAINKAKIGVPIILSLLTSTCLEGGRFATSKLLPGDHGHSLAHLGSPYPLQSL